VSIWPRQSKEKFIMGYSGEAVLTLCGNSSLSSLKVDEISLSGCHTSDGELAMLATAVGSILAH